MRQRRQARYKMTNQTTPNGLITHRNHPSKMEFAAPLPRRNRCKCHFDHGGGTRRANLNYSQHAQRAGVIDAPIVPNGSNQEAAAAPGRDPTSANSCFISLLAAVGAQS